MEKGIELFRPVFEINECLAEIRDCLEKGWTGLGYKTVEFEEKWKEYTGLPYPTSPCSFLGIISKRYYGVNITIINYHFLSSVSYKLPLKSIKRKACQSCSKVKKSISKLCP